MRVTVFGAGGWGTALASILAEKHGNVSLYVRNLNLAARIRQERENSVYLPGVLLPRQVVVSSDMAEVLYEAELLVLAVPSHGVRNAAKNIAPLLQKGCIVVSVAKGLEIESCLRMTEVLNVEMPAVQGRFVVLSGPNHAEEVGRRLPSASVVASNDAELAECAQDAFMTSNFRVYTNRDIVGVELGGALKNIIAIGTGIAEGLGFGDNAKAALMTRGLAEIARLGAACGADAATFSGLAGLGDLIATCTSIHSRNRRAGLSIAKGRNSREIQGESGMVVEGIRATSAARELSRRLGVEMPITEALYQVLYNGQPPQAAVAELMGRGKKHETEELAFPGPAR